MCCDRLCLWYKKNTPALLFSSLCFVWQDGDGCNGCWNGRNSSFRFVVRLLLTRLYIGICWRRAITLSDIFILVLITFFEISLFHIYKCQIKRLKKFKDCVVDSMLWNVRCEPISRNLYLLPCVNMHEKKHGHKTRIPLSGQTHRPLKSVSFKLCTPKSIEDNKSTDKLDLFSSIMFIQLMQVFTVLCTENKSFHCCHSSELSKIRPTAKMYINYSMQLV